MILVLVNDLLDLAKIEQFKFKLHDDYFDLSKMIRMSCMTMMPLADVRGVKLSCSFRFKPNQD